MGHGVIADFMAAPQHLAREFGMRGHLFPDHEKHRLHLMFIQHIQQERRVTRIGAVVDGDEDVPVPGAAAHRPEPLAAWPQHRQTITKRQCSAPPEIAHGQPQRQPAASAAACRVMKNDRRHAEESAIAHFPHPNRNKRRRIQNEQSDPAPCDDRRQARPRAYGRPPTACRRPATSATGLAGPRPTQGEWQQIEREKSERQRQQQSARGPQRWHSHSPMRHHRRQAAPRRRESTTRPRCMPRAAYAGRLRHAHGFPAPPKTRNRAVTARLSDCGTCQ